MPETARFQLLEHAALDICLAANFVIVSVCFSYAAVLSGVFICFTLWQATFSVPYFADVTQVRENKQKKCLIFS